MKSESVSGLGRRHHHDHVRVARCAGAVHICYTGDRSLAVCSQYGGSGDIGHALLPAAISSCRLDSAGALSAFSSLRIGPRSRRERKAKKALFLRAHRCFLYLISYIFICEALRSRFLFFERKTKTKENERNWQFPEKPPAAPALSQSDGWLSPWGPSLGSCPSPPPCCPRLR